VVDPDVVVVQIADADYHDKNEPFQHACPLPVAGVTALIRAVALSAPKVIVVDLDTADWPPGQRAAALADADSALGKLGFAQPSVAWAIGGAQETGGGGHDTGTLNAEQIKDDPVSCFGVPAAIPDSDGVVRGYLPYLLQQQPPKTVLIPSLAVAASQLSKGRGCTSDVQPQAGEQTPADDLVDYSGGPERFLHLTAGTVLGAADSPAWQNSNPLKSEIAIIGGSFQEGRDRYVTPVGYINGIDILASAVATALKGGVREPSRDKFILVDVLVGMFLVTGGYFMHRYWLLAISFIAIPFVAFGASFLVFAGTRYFMSFIPVVAAVFLHHLIEHAVEHWRMQRELRELRARG
jgi:CHASE2 domain-containing sensor protein